ncbi:hypothetical protein I6E52_00210 [Salinibacterium sp. NG253]|uniref:hypothetical protein n=1 Tax=Salinibacterium sp. NG253 TaxID=2792039 RepID=UPI0018CCA667|nr:hypothetical protein [Salinibacterium sp. NG253]MBH0115265.1 hypothetical protein [Salinibacterium sp. NG253]
MKLRSGAVCVLVFSTAVAVAGCAGPSDDGPLRFGADEDRVCAPVDQYPHIALGTQFDLDGDDPITITSVDAIDPLAVTLVSVSVMPVDSPSLRLLLDHYPPVEQFPDNWPDAVPAIGYTVTPGDIVDLVAEVKSTNQSAGSLEGLMFHYTVLGREYMARTHLGLDLTAGLC